MAMLTIFLSISHTSTGQSKFKLSEKFNQGMREFNAENYKSSIKTFSKIVKRYSKHSPSIAQLALAYYRLEKYDGAYIYFSRLKESDVPKSAFFEFAYVNYLKKEWKKSAKFFSQLGQDHPLYDLGMYYSGVCYFNLEEYKESISHLKKSVILPSRFSNSRRILLKIAKKNLKKIIKSPNPEKKPQVLSKTNSIKHPKHSQKQFQTILYRALTREARNAINSESKINTANLYYEGGVQEVRKKFKNSSNC